MISDAMRDERDQQLRHWKQIRKVARTARNSALTFYAMAKVSGFPKDDLRPDTREALARTRQTVVEAHQMAAEAELHVLMLEHWMMEEDTSQTVEP